MIINNNQNWILYLLLLSFDDLLSLPKEEPLLVCWLAPNNLNFDGGGKLLAEFSLKVEAEFLSLETGVVVPLVDVFLNDDRLSLSDNLPYSPNFLGGGIRLLAGLCRLEELELSESPPSDFLRSWISLLSNRLYSPSFLGRPDLCERGGLGKELGGKEPERARNDAQLSELADPELVCDTLVESCMRCCWLLRPCFSRRRISPLSCLVGGTRFCRKPVVSNRLLFPTPASSGLGSLPFRGEALGLVNPGKQQSPRWNRETERRDVNQELKG